ncbi:partial L-allo-threonine aldolase, partial [Anaerolineae bacterium]
DHAHAKHFAEQLADLPGIALDPERVKSNIVFFELSSGVTAAEMEARLKSAGILISASGKTRMRAVTHYGIERADVDAAIDAIRLVFSE